MGDAWMQFGLKQTADSSSAHEEESFTSSTAWVVLGASASSKQANVRSSSVSRGTKGMVPCGNRSAHHLPHSGSTKTELSGGVSRALRRHLSDTKTWSATSDVDEFRQLRGRQFTGDAQCNRTVRTNDDEERVR